MRRLFLSCVLTWIVLLPACAGASAPWVELKGRRFQVEVAADDESRARGLMFRDRLAPDRGMLFVFERAEPQAFWMKNTRIPLDILYFDAQRRLVTIAAGVPPCTTPQCPSYPSEAPAQFTLELKAGMAREIGAQRGDELRLDPGIALPAGLIRAGSDPDSNE